MSTKVTPWMWIRFATPARVRQRGCQVGCSAARPPGCLISWWLRPVASTT